jgi:hypothetical protein
VTGLLKTFSKNKVFNHFRNLRLIEKLFIQGFIVVAILVIIQLWLGNVRESFMSYMPPLGFIFFLVIEFFVQPLIIGVINIVIINGLCKTKGWQVGFWLNGVFLLLAFSTINLLLQTTFGLSFLPYVVLVDLLLSLPFGCIARFSNGGWKKPLD